MKLAESLKTLSHHAYAVIGDTTARDEVILILEKRHKIEARGNPDFFDRRYETFGIDDSREVKAFAETRPVSESGKKIFILTMTGITIEAQNALLKLLEEPPTYAHFFLILSSAHLLLATVKSRLFILQNIIQKYSKSGSGNGSAAVQASEFLRLPLAKRLDYIKSFMEEITKEKRPKRDALDFLNAFQAAVYERGVKKNLEPLKAIETARTYMNDRAPSLKMLLEYVALNV